MSAGVDETYTLNLLQRLIEIDSTNPHLVPEGKGEGEIADFIYTELKQLTSSVEKQTVAGNRCNVIARMDSGRRGNTLLLNGHMDTVGFEAMTVPALVPSRRQGRIFGRGSADMKSGLAAMVTACRTLAERSRPDVGEVIFSFVVDEEYKSAGTQRLLECLGADAAIVCEPTDLRIGLAHKGFVWARVDIAGRSAHGSRPEEGIDAILKSANLLREMEKLNRRLLRRRPHPLLGTASLHGSVIEGGGELSSYPARCSITFERRILPEENADTFREEIGRILDAMKRRDPQFNAESRIMFSRPGQELDRREPIARVLADAFQAVIGKPPEFGGVSWWMDTALITSAGIPAIAFGPRGYGLHGARESVDIDSVLLTAGILVEAVGRFCHPDPGRSSSAGNP